MATFRVGQRVRVQENIHNGKWWEGTILSGLVTRRGSSDRKLGHEVRVDNNPSWYAGGIWWSAPEYITPLQPERNQVIPWAECLWRPTRTEEHA